MSVKPIRYRWLVQKRTQNGLAQRAGPLESAASAAPVLTVDVEVDVVGGCAGLVADRAHVTATGNRFSLMNDKRSIPALAEWVEI